MENVGVWEWHPGVPWASKLVVGEGRGSFFNRGKVGPWLLCSDKMIPKESFLLGNKETLCREHCPVPF